MQNSAQLNDSSPRRVKSTDKIRLVRTGHRSFYCQIFDGKRWLEGKIEQNDRLFVSELPETISLDYRLPSSFSCRVLQGSEARYQCPHRGDIIFPLHELADTATAILVLPAK